MSLFTLTILIFSFCIFILYPLCGSVITDTDVIEHCEHLQQSNDTQIALLGMVKHVSNKSSTTSNLLLITTKQLVYELSLENTQLSNEGLNFSEVTPVSLVQKWPSLKSLPTSSLSRLVTLLDEQENTWILMLFDGQIHDENGFNCTLLSTQTGQVESRRFVFKDIQVGRFLSSSAGHWISSTESGFYVLTADDNITLVRIKMDFGANVIQTDGAPLKLCQYSDTFRGAEKLIAVEDNNESSSKNDCNFRLNWNLQLPSSNTSFIRESGFTDSKWFVVLGTKFAYIFATVALTKPGTIVSVTQLNFSQLINCPPRDDELMSPLHKLIMIVVLFAVVVLIIAMAFFQVYLLQYDAFQKTPTLIEKDVAVKRKTKSSSKSQKEVDCKECAEIVTLRKKRQSQKQIR